MPLKCAQNENKAWDLRMQTKQCELDARNNGRGCLRAQTCSMLLHCSALNVLGNGTCFTATSGSST